MLKALCSQPDSALAMQAVGFIHNQQRRRGSMMVLVLMMLIVITVLVGIAVDSAWVSMSHTESQAAADLAARSALSYYATNPDANDRFGESTRLAIRILNDNEVAGKKRRIVNARVEFGYLEDPDVKLSRFISSRDESEISAVFIEKPISRFNRQADLFFGPIFGVKNAEIGADATVTIRKIDIVLCLDASRSMAGLPQRGFPSGGGLNKPPLPGSRWFILIDTIEEFLGALREVNPNARVGLVTFGGGATNAVSSPLDDQLARSEVTLSSFKNWPKIPETLESYLAHPALGLGTSLFDGLDQSIDMLVNNSTTVATEKVIVFLSDGAQAGVVRPDPIVAAQRAAAENIMIHSVSFGGRVSVLKSLSDEVGGDVIDALDADELRKAFNELLGKFRVRLAD